MALGYNSLTTNTTGVHNTAVGSNALKLNLDGHSNAAVGKDSLIANTEGLYNSAIGLDSLKANTTGDSNTAVGYQALLTNISSNSNTAVGFRALKLATGASNIGIGRDAGDNITSGAGNVIIGAIDAGSATGNTQLIIADGTDGSVKWIDGDSSGNLTFGGDITVGDDLNLTTDSTVINFGADSDTTLTHTDGTGLTLNSTNKICFNDTSQFIYGVSNAILGLGATDEIDLTATAIDINGTCDVSGTLTNDSAAVKVVGTETIWIPANAMTPTESNGCASITAVETTSGRPDMYVLDFDKDSDEHAQFTVAFPKSWNAGTITFQAFWSGLAATGGVSWGLQGVAFADNDSIDTAYGTAVVVDDAEQGAVEEVNVSAASGAVTIAGSPGDNELCYFRIFRDVSDTNDNSGGDARLHGIKIFYTTDAKNDA